MMKDCKLCSFATGPVEELFRIYQKPETPRLMHVLTEIIATDNNLHQADRTGLADILHLLTAVMQEREQERDAEILFLKRPA